MSNIEGKASLRHSALFRACLLAVMLMATWLLWSGLYKPLLIGLGVFSCAITVYVVHRMGYFANETFAFRYRPWRLLAYWFWLIKEIVLSSIAVTKLVLAKEIKVSPQTVTLDVSEFDALNQAVFGNSITLTPGTLTLDLFKDRIIVHALTAEIAASLQTGEMQRRVASLKGN